MHGKDVEITKAIDSARRGVMQQMLGKGAEDALIADAMLAVRQREEAERERRRSQQVLQKKAAKRLKDDAAVVAEEKARVAEMKARLRLEAEAQEKEQEAIDAARSFDTQDFRPVQGEITQNKKNRWVAMQRVLLCSKALPPEKIKSLARDWAKWDAFNIRSDTLFPSPNAYAIQYTRWMGQMLAHLAENRGDKVARWWLAELEKKIVEADVVVPALPPDLIKTATHLHGDAPTGPNPASVAKASGSAA